MIEDDALTRRVVADALTAEGHRVTAVGTAAAGEGPLRAGGLAAVVLDVWLPDGDGIALCRQWRRAGIRVPILMLTARTDVSCRVAGLDAGADDYLGKPFALSELRARLRALLRRADAGAAERTLRQGAVTVDFARRQAWLGSTEVPLTRRELDVLERLFWARGRVVGREDLLEEVWGEATPETSASLEVIVARLRRKLEPPPDGVPVVRTVRGLGYALASPAGGPEA